MQTVIDRRKEGDNSATLKAKPTKTSETTLNSNGSEEDQLVNIMQDMLEKGEDAGKL